MSSIEVFKQRILPLKDKLFRFAFRLLRDVQEAEDAVQEVMVGIWVKREQWGEWGSMEAYCMTSVRNNCLDRIRRRKTAIIPAEGAWEVRSMEKDPYEKMKDKETIERIRQCMEELPKNQQLVIQLREIEGFSYNEIAEVLGMTMDQVKTNLFRGRNAIRKSITKEDKLWNKQS